MEERLRCGKSCNVFVNVNLQAEKDRGDKASVISFIGKEPHSIHPFFIAEKSWAAAVQQNSTDARINFSIKPFLRID